MDLNKSGKPHQSSLIFHSPSHSPFLLVFCYVKPPERITAIFSLSDLRFEYINSLSLYVSIFNHKRVQQDITDLICCIHHLKNMFIFISWKSAASLWFIIFFQGFNFQALQLWKRKSTLRVLKCQPKHHPTEMMWARLLYFFYFFTNMKLDFRCILIFFFK